MLDIKRIKEDPEKVKAGLRAKEVDCDQEVDRILELDKVRRDTIFATEQMKAEQNKVSKTIPQLKKAGEDMGLRNQFNTAISAIMELVNAMYTYRDKMGDSEGERNVFSSAMATVITTLSPITPHICEELWERLGHTSHLAGDPWPTYDEKAMVKDTQTIALQVNGKLRGTMEAPTGADKKTLEDLALATEQIRRFTKDLTIRKVIVVPGKIVNVVAK